MAQTPKLRQRNQAAAARNLALHTAMVNAKAELVEAQAKGDRRKIRQAQARWEEAVAELVNANMALVIRAAKRLARDNDGGQLMEELVAEGRAALTEGALSWDPSKSTLSNWVLMSLPGRLTPITRMAESNLTQNAYEQRPRVLAARRRLVEAGNPHPTTDEIAAEILSSGDIEVGRDTIELIIRDNDAGRNVSLDAPAGSESDTTVGDLLDVTGTDWVDEVLTGDNSLLFGSPDLLRRLRSNRVAWAIPEHTEGEWAPRRGPNPKQYPGAESAVEIGGITIIETRTARDGTDTHVPVTVGRIYLDRKFLDPDLDGEPFIPFKNPNSTTRRVVAIHRDRSQIGDVLSNAPTQVDHVVGVLDPAGLFALYSVVADDAIGLSGHKTLAEVSGIGRETVRKIQKEHQGFVGAFSTATITWRDPTDLWADPALAPNEPEGQLDLLNS